MIKIESHAFLIIYEELIPITVHQCGPVGHVCFTVCLIVYNFYHRDVYEEELKSLVEAIKEKAVTDHHRALHHLCKAEVNIALNTDIQ